MTAQAKEAPECKAALHLESEDCKASASELTFVRLKIPRLIPSPLIDAVKGKTFTPDSFYLYQEGQVENPNNLLYALVDEAKKIHGFLWAEVNLLDRAVFVNTFSITKDYWGKGMAMPIVIKFLIELKKKIGSPKVLWCTGNERYFKKHGFKRSKITLMEYDLPS